MMSRSHGDLTLLMSPTFSGSKDDFGKEFEKLSPLSFDRINEGQPFSSDFLLCRLPVELLWQVVKLIAEQDLENLALVNRDCRQLARSRQFAIIKLDYSDRAFGILDILAKECRERSRKPATIMAPSIGACIRKITVAADPRWITHRYKVELSEDFLALDPEVRKDRLDQACNDFFGRYIPKINLVLSNAQAIPHLESLTWADSSPVDGNFFKAIVSLNLRHLALERLSLGEHFLLDLSTENCRWRLESLNLHVEPGDKQRTSMSLLTSKLFCLASPTLKSLTWASSFNLHSNSVVQPPDLGTGRPAFRCLRELHVDTLTRYHPSWLDILIQPGGLSPLRSLEIDICKNEAVMEFFCNCGYLPNLEVFVWRAIGFGMKNTSLAFLQANCHIRKLRIDGAAPGFLEDEVLPLLCSRFDHLTSLAIRWPEDHDYIPRKALDQISRLQGLEQLWISSGFQAGWKHTWVTDHAALQSCVRNLPSLRKLALSRDTYSDQSLNGQAGAEPERYYEDKVLRNLTTIMSRPFFQEGDIEKKLDRTWEMQHQNDMATLAASYAFILSNLEWIYLGQRPMRIARSNSLGTAQPVFLSKERDDCWTFLRRLFGTGR
ncbi:hypothetical protein IQ07DRAFT_338930 [Pyrenochaeta sp. DS3sAY3a]|nr:hypothetical protein IQ07DRAFT_338930 [Pyrenochaeta sp. DS3sAY3a]